MSTQDVPCWFCGHHKTWHEDGLACKQFDDEWHEYCDCKIYMREGRPVEEAAA